MAYLIMQHGANLVMYDAKYGEADRSSECVRRHFADADGKCEFVIQDDGNALVRTEYNDEDEDDALVVKVVWEIRTWYSVFMVELGEMVEKLWCTRKV